MDCPCSYCSSAPMKPRSPLGHICAHVWYSTWMEQWLAYTPPFEGWLKGWERQLLRKRVWDDDSYWDL